ncbi:MAG: hypothetical protein EXR75_00775 [Myxococcales bacterium]|nr:hypothetical protein [Myxococcales bacterium]
MMLATTTLLAATIPGTTTLATTLRGAGCAVTRACPRSFTMVVGTRCTDASMPATAGTPYTRALLVPLVTALLAASLVFVVLRLLLPAPLPPTFAPAPRAAVTVRHARHLVFVVVDGLRYDVATDERLMPRFARNMRDRSSGEIWSGPVSMTSAAVLAYGTGRRGDIEQIVLNETAAATHFDHLPGIVKDAGLGTAATGDVAWFSLFPDAWDTAHPDPPGLAIDVDFNAEIFEASRRILALVPRPALTILHFVTPDHQAHAYGATSDRYRAHIHAFDALLDQLLAELSADTTVFVTSDHGANDRGTHGADTPIQRRSPIFAYGPGVRAGQHPTQPLDQLDIPDTLAFLLGIRAPVHGVGHILAEWLDVSPTARADAARGSLERLVRLAEETGFSGARDTLVGSALDLPEAQIAAARRSASALATRVMAATPAESPGKWLALGLVALAAVAVALAALERIPRVALAFSAQATVVLVAAAAVGVLITARIETLPGKLSLYVQGGLTALGVALMLAAFARAGTLDRWLEPKFPAYARAGTLDRWLEPKLAAIAVIPVAALVVTYPAYTQPLAYWFVAFSAVYLLARGSSSEHASTAPGGGTPGGRSGWARGRLRLVLALSCRCTRPSPRCSRGRLRLVLALALLGGFWRLGFATEHLLDDALFATVPRAALVLAVTMLALLADRLLARPEDRALSRLVPLLTLALLVAAASLTRGKLPSLVGVLGWAGAPVLALFVWRRHRSLAELLFLVAFALVARPSELVLFVATTFIGEAIAAACGEALRQHSRSTPIDRPNADTVPAQGDRPSPLVVSASTDRPRALVVIALVLLTFSLVFLQRVGVQGGLDFTQLDFGAGTFASSSTSYLQIGGAIVTKHLLATFAILVAVLGPLERGHRASVARAFFATELARMLVLTAMLFACRTSFWTAMRVMSDLPHAMLAALAASLACAFMLVLTSPAGQPHGSS